MTGTGGFDARIRVARKEYKCESGPYTVCNKMIRAGDTYFAYTLVSPHKYKTKRYCLECARIYHPDLLQGALPEIRNAKKRKAAGRKVSRSRFLIGKALQFKKKMTASEQFLWDHIRSRKLGVTFYHQVVVDNYIVDFWCPEQQLVIELDGSRHGTRKEADLRKDEALKFRGIRVLRFPSALVFHDLQYLLERIRERVILTEKNSSRS